LAVATFGLTVIIVGERTSRGATTVSINTFGDRDVGAQSRTILSASSQRIGCASIVVITFRQSRARGWRVACLTFIDETIVTIRGAIEVVLRTASRGATAVVVDTGDDCELSATGITIVGCAKEVFAGARVTIVDTFGGTDAVAGFDRAVAGFTGIDSGVATEG
jgi:hypothetical protein